MRVSMAVNGVPVVSGSRKAMLQRQIRRLEQKRDELLEKLGANKTSETSTPELPSGTVRVNTSRLIGQEAGTSFESGTGMSQPDASFSGTWDFGKALRELADGMSEGMDSALPPEDSKEVLKQLQLIEMQIMTLRQQLGDDAPAPSVPEAEGDAAAIALSGMETREALKMAESAASLPPAGVMDNGHVDGYA